MVLFTFTTHCKHLIWCCVLRERASNIKACRNIRFAKWCREAAITVRVLSCIYPPLILNSGMDEQYIFHTGIWVGKSLWGKCGWSLIKAQIKTCSSSKIRLVLCCVFTERITGCCNGCCPCWLCFGILYMINTLRCDRNWGDRRHSMAQKARSSTQTLQ